MNKLMKLLSIIAMTGSALLGSVGTIHAEDAQKLLEQQIKQLEKDNPALAAQLKNAMKQLGGVPSSGQGPNKGFASSSGSSSSSNGTAESFSIKTTEKGSEIKSIMANVDYLIAGDLNDTASLKISINGKQYVGMNTVPTQFKTTVDNLIKKGRTSAKVNIK